MTLRIGLLNMMADKALAVSERHFARLLGAEAGRTFELVKFSIPAIPRPPELGAYLAREYRPAAEIPTAGLDVLAVTGANVSDPDLPRQVFWPDLTRSLTWARDTGLPTLCSCLATHAVLEAWHGVKRQPVAPKIWGVFTHRASRVDHPLLRGVAPEVPVPHSRHNDIAARSLIEAGYDVLLASDQAGVHLAVEREAGRLLMLQGHPEYEAVSLLKEYKREVQRWQDGDRSDYPPVPYGLCPPAALARLAAHRSEVEARCAAGREPPAFPEAEVSAMLTNTWTAPAVRIVGNWLDAVTPD